MIQTINASTTKINQNLNTNATTFAGTNVSTEASTKASTKAEDTKTTQDENGINSVSKDGDVMTISSSSLKIYSGTSSDSVSNSETGTAKEGSTGTHAAALANFAAEAGIDGNTALKNENSADTSAVGGSSTSSSSSSQLSQYTESQLKDMLDEGEITRAEYDEEIQSREESAASSGTTAASNDTTAASSDTTEASNGTTAASNANEIEK